MNDTQFSDTHCAASNGGSPQSSAPAATANSESPESRAPSAASNGGSLRSAEDALAALFTAARTARAFLDEPAPVDAVRRAYDNARWAPTALNSQPLRLDLLVSSQSRQRLVPLMMESNRQTVTGAPLSIIISAVAEPSQSMRALGAPDRALGLVAASPDAGARLARDSALIQLGYLTLALRAEGLDVGVMTGADMAGIDAEFHPDGAWRAIAVVNVGHAAQDAYRPRAGRHEFDEIARIH